MTANGSVGPVTRVLQQRFLDVARGRVDDAHGWLTLVQAGGPGRQGSDPQAAESVPEPV